MNQEDRLLTDEEMTQAILDAAKDREQRLCWQTFITQHGLGESERAIAKAQDIQTLRKVVGWLESKCLEHEHKYKTIRRYCFECRREMRAEAGMSYHPAREAEEVKGDKADR